MKLKSWGERGRRRRKQCRMDSNKERSFSPWKFLGSCRMGGHRLLSSALPSLPLSSNFATVGGGGLQSKVEVISRRHWGDLAYQEEIGGGSCPMERVASSVMSSSAVMNPCLFELLSGHLLWKSWWEDSTKVTKMWLWLCVCSLTVNKESVWWCNFTMKWKPLQPGIQFLSMHKRLCVHSFALWLC